MRIYKYIIFLLVALLASIEAQSQCLIISGTNGDITFKTGEVGEQQMFEVYIGTRFNLSSDELCDSEITFLNVPDWVSIEFYAASNKSAMYKLTALSENLVNIRKAEVTMVSVTNTRTFNIEQRLSADSDFQSEDFNHITSQSFDITGKPIAKSRAYFDELGKGIQSQSWDVKTKRVWATQTEYDDQGRPVLSTSSAPIGTSIGYQSGFVRNSTGNVFTKADLGTLDTDPSPIAATANTLGAYYGESTTEKYQDITDRPYSRTFYDELNPGKTLKTVGGNKIDTDGDGTPDSYPQGFSYTMPAWQELFYAFGKDEFFEIANSKFYVYPKLQKTVSIDVHGEELVSFSTQDGQLLASARSGYGPKKEIMSLIGRQGFIDIHLPNGCEGSLTFIDGANEYIVFDLRTSQQILDKSNLPAGVYRIQTTLPEGTVTNNTTYLNNDGIIRALSDTPKGVTYDINYYDYSLNYYDDAGNLKSSLPAIGFDNDAYGSYNLAGEVSHLNESLKSHYEYNTLGQLVYTSSPDQGEAWFKYRSDGQIRFSQNTKQKENNEFSYTNYDERSRPVESGVYKETNTYSFSTSGTNVLDSIIDDRYTFLWYRQDLDPLKNNYCSEQQFTLHDTPDNNSLQAAFGSDTRASNYEHQSFVQGAVSKSYTQNPQTTTTWYSYDIYGRVTWIVQQIDGLDGVKTIDYVYDDITGAVNKVYYQKDKPGEEFIHRYTYDPDDQSLIKVETATSDSGNYTVHADYEYYETGGLKRIELAEGLQGIDYVYNLNGSLKAINHPSLESAKDPGGDTNDVFGMMIDYYKGDYKRAGVHMESTHVGTDQYNGNIKAVHWNNKATDANTLNQKTYAYQYNRNNWLTDAQFLSNTSAMVQEFISKVNETITQDLKASEQITLGNGVTITGTTNLITLGIGESSETAVDDYAVSGITYDANGNIQSLKRNKNTQAGSNAMDDLSYVYKEDKPNQLVRVEDAVTTETNTNDIKTQTGNNYVYNSIGQLVENTEEEITYEYNARGLVTLVKKEGKPLVSFTYNDRGQRIKKGNYDLRSGHLNYYEYYVRDISGTPMAMYRYGKLGEHTVYGASRLGVYNRISNSTNYELTDHLGNVRAIIAKDHQIKGGTDYYPFGMSMPGKNTESLYRYAYQGQEKDPETGKEAFELRLWDARIGRWLTTDPAGQYASPYLGMGNNPISRVDPDGGTDGEVFDSSMLEEVLVTAKAPPIQRFLNHITLNPGGDLFINSIDFFRLDEINGFKDSYEFKIWEEHTTGKYPTTIGELKKIYESFPDVVKNRARQILTYEKTAEFISEIGKIVAGNQSSAIRGKAEEQLIKPHSFPKLLKGLRTVFRHLNTAYDISAVTEQTLYHKELISLEHNGPNFIRHNPDNFKSQPVLIFPK